MYQCLEGGVIAVLQSYVDEDVSEGYHLLSNKYLLFLLHKGLLVLWKTAAILICFCRPEG